MLGLVALLVFTSLALVGYAASIAMQQRNEARRALTGRLRSMTGPSSDLSQAPLLKDQRLSSIPLLNSILGNIPAVLPIVRMIRQAGLRRRVGEVLLYIPLLACIAFVMAVMLGRSRLFGFACAAIAGALPLLVVSRMRRKRAMQFGEQLPDSLDLIRSALQAGHGLISAFAVVAETFPDPIAQEFRYLVEEVRLGLPIREALTNLAERVDDPNLPILVVGILVAQDVGGNLAEVIDNIAYTIRERSKIMREIKVLTAQGRLSGWVLTSLPFLVAFVMYFFNRKYFDPLLTSTTGRYMIAYALVSILIGNIIIRRLIKIEV